MLPNLPLDVDCKQIRVGDRVVFGADNGTTLIIGEVWKITNCFVWIKGHGSSFRRGSVRVVVLEKGK